VSNKMAYNSKTNTQENNVNDIVLESVLKVLENNTSTTWIGTMTDLRTDLSKVLGKKRAAMLPGSPGALRVVMNRIINRLRNRRVSVKFGRTPDHARTRYVEFTTR
jgi:hypothetical protein